MSLFLYNERKIAKVEPDVIKITEDMLINLGPMPDPDTYAELLFDETDKVGNPPQAAPQTSWRLIPNSSAWVEPSLIIDLQQEYIITEIYFYDGPHNNGNVKGGGFKLYEGKPFHWEDEPLVDYTMENSSEWKNVKFEKEVKTRYLHMQKFWTETFIWSDMTFYCDANVSEMVIYGVPVGKVAAAPVPAESPDFGITMGGFIGTNSFIWDKPETLECVGFIREYHNWSSTDPMNKYYPNNTNEFAPYGVFSDKYYRTLVENGIGINICVQTATEPGDSAKPAWAGPSTEAASYAAHADHMFQLAARYGKTEVDESLLRATNFFKKKSALGYINYFENWNEPDPWWASDKEWFSPYELAAMSSADYDGHASTMGDNFGIKNADPNAKFVMGGLSTMSLGYIRGMLLWFDEFRPDDNTVFDVLNFHHYCFSGKTGCSPEKDNLKEKMKELVEFRNKYFPNSEVWLSEFGWDRNQGSPLAAVAHAGFDENEVQAQWLVREYMILTAAGIDRAQQYMLDDAVSEDSDGRHMTSGMINYKKEKMPSWYYVATLKNRLNTMRFENEVDSGNENVWVYSFKEVDNNDGALAVWCPTEDGTEVLGYRLELPAGTASAVLVTLTDKSVNGVETELAITDGAVFIDVSERPVFVMVSDRG